MTPAGPPRTTPRPTDERDIALSDVVRRLNEAHARLAAVRARLAQPARRPAPVDVRA